MYDNNIAAAIKTLVPFENVCVCACVCAFVVTLNDAFFSLAQLAWACTGRRAHKRRAQLTTQSMSLSKSFLV